MKKLIALMLFICVAVTLCACSESAEGTESSAASVEESKAVSESVSESVSEASAEEQTAAFKVYVVDASGNPVAGVMIQLCKDTCIPAKTGEDGVATFKAEITDGYKLSVLTCPEGYTYEGESEIYLESGITEYTVELSEGSAK
ncbi:MAG: hypothetical protein IIW39_00855 [Clostridia bacterium]|jgi:hypothetical protein|nr:hypothetical protein [Clostridia bacterium]